MSSALDDDDLSDTDISYHKHASNSRSFIRPRHRLSTQSGKASPIRAENSYARLSAENGQNGAQALPPIESFAFRSNKGKAEEMVEDLPADDNLVDFDGDGGDRGRPMLISGIKRKARRYVVSDDSEDELGPVRQKREEASRNEEASIERVRQVKQDEEEEEFPEVIPSHNEEKLTHFQEEEKEGPIENKKQGILENEEKQAEEIGAESVQVDLIGNTLQKCDEIAATLRKELNIGGSGDSEDTEVDASVAKIVSQVRAE